MSDTPGISLTLRVLRRSPNPAATEVLAAGVCGSESELRRGAVRALAERPDTGARTELLRALAEAPADAREESRKRGVTRRMRRAVAAAVQSGDVPLTKRACRYAIDAELYSALPAIVEQAMLADHPYAVGLATAALQLSRGMAAHLESRSIGDSSREIDPAFFRTAALQRLADAVERFGDHRRLELVEALLLITTRDNATLMRLLRTDGHPCHGPLIEALRESPSYGAMDVLVNAIVDSDAPERLLSIAADRADKPFLARMTDQIGYPIGLRPRENARRAARFAWMAEELRGAVRELNATQQASAAELATATSAPASERLRFLRFLLAEGRPEGRVAACHLLRGFDSPDVKTLLGEALKDEAPGVVAAAAKQVRALGVPGAEVVLIGLLEHAAEPVRRAAQGELHELNLAAYRELFPRLPEPARRSAGRLVARADPEAPELLAVELQRPVVDHRLEALSLIDAMGLVDELAGPLTTALGDADLAVRAEAARLLGAATEPSEPLVGGLVRAADDGNLAVRAAAEKSLGSLRSLANAAALVDRLLSEHERGELPDIGEDRP